MSDRRQLVPLKTPITLTFSLFGEDALIKNMERVGEEAQRVILKKAVFAAGEPIVRALQGGAPVQDAIDRARRQPRRNLLLGISPAQILSDSIAYSWSGWPRLKFVTIGAFAHHGIFQELRGPHKGWARRSWIGVRAEARARLIATINKEIAITIAAGGGRRPTPFFGPFFS